MLVRLSNALCCFLAISLAAVSAPAANEYEYAKSAKPYLDFIKDHLLRRLDVPGQSSMNALTETERPIQNDVWYWTDDNAKALEAFVAPDAYPQYKEVADGLAQFIMSMSSGQLILRRRAEDRFDLVSQDPANARLTTGLMTHHGAVASGQFFTSYKFHDNLTADAVSHTGNFVRVTLDGNKYLVDVENNITSANILRDSDTVIFRTESAVKIGPEPERIVGHVVYSYSFREGAPGIGLEIKFNAADYPLEQVEVTSAVDQLNAREGIDPRVRYSRICASVNGAPYCKDNLPDERTAVFKGPVDLFSIIQKGTAGFSYGIHFKVLEPNKLEAIVAEGQKEGNLNWVYAVYNLGSIPVGGSASVKETRILTSGGLYEDYAAYIDLFNDLNKFSNVDLSVSYDYGAEINAMACYYMFAERGLYGASAPLERLPDIRAWLDRHITAYRRNVLREVDGKYPYVFGRGLAFYALGLDCMIRATGDTKYRDALKQAVDVLLQMRHDTEPSPPESIKGGIRCDANNSHLDCHAAGLLALARAAIILKDPRLAPMIAEGVRFIRTGEPVAEEASARVKFEDDGSLWVPVNAGAPKPLDGTLWIFKAGLTLRAMEAIELAVKHGALPNDPLLLADVDRVRRAAQRQILLAVRSRGDEKEFLTSFRSGETNSETQPWVSLGVVPIDPVIVGVVPPEGSARAQSKSEAQ